MVGDSLQVARDQDAVDGLLGKARILLDELEQVGMGAPVHAVDFVVHLPHRISQAGIALEQGLDGGADHASGKLTHGGKVDR